MYPETDPSKLTEEQKQAVVALATLAAGIVGGVVGGDVSSAIDGAKAGKNEVENNALAVIAAEAAANTAAAMAGAAGNAGKNTVNDDEWDTGDICEGTREQCSVRDGNRGPGHAINGDGQNGEEGPNIGKDLSDADKAELGGTGSGTPGGWGPEDEENARNSETGQKPTAGEQIGKWSVDELSDGAKHIDPASKKGDLTLAGRALQSMEAVKVVHSLQRRGIHHL